MKKSELINIVREVIDEKKKRPGLWANINAKRKRGEKPSHGNSNAHKAAVAAGKKIKKEDIDEPVKPGILKDRLGSLSCSKVRKEKSKLKDKGTHYAKALQRYLNYHCQ